MLELNIEEKELYHQETNKFIQIPACTLTLEHSLISLSKWESKWKIPYLSKQERTPKQDLDYVRCMVIGPLKDDKIIDALSFSELKQIQTYISSPMTATTFQNTPINNKKSKNEVMTSEVIYAHMFAHRIPIDCQKWHLNRLLTLLKICDLQNAPKDKMTKKQTAMLYAERNAARKAKHNSRG